MKTRVARRARTRRLGEQWRRARIPARLVATFAGIALAALGAARAEEAVTVGRVRISRVALDTEGEARAAYEARLASEAGRPAADRRLLSFRPLVDDPGRFEATVYDYAQERAFELVLDSTGKEIERRPSTAIQLPPSEEELAEALSIVAVQSPWAEKIALGTHEIYAAMPPVGTNDQGQRLIHVGVLGRDREGLGPSEHEIVGVHVASGGVFRYPDGAPDAGRAELVVCGPPVQSCGATSASCGALYRYEWPAGNPLWKFDVMTPRCSRSVQPDGTGLELQNVYYRNRLLFARAHMPVLNVKYAGNACGPYRDWLYAEDCFQASGTVVSPGILVTGSTPPATFCETRSDAGNFKGVAIHDEGGSLWLNTEIQAGHYRYVMQWRFHQDGSLQPIFAFGGVSNSCTCIDHFHHAYWRFEVALDGVAGNTSTGISTLARRVAGSPISWSPVNQEGVFSRPASGMTTDWWRLRNPQTGLTYVLEPGPRDTAAQGDPYAKGDLWALALNANQIDDPNSDTSIAINGWINGESLGTTKRLVLWYRAGWRHNHDTDPSDACEYVGPTLRPQSCLAELALARTSHGCNDTIELTLSDADRIGAGTQAVTLRSTREAAPETLVLIESPSGSGRFVGSFPTTSAAPVLGDGRLSVAHGDTVTASYADAVSCGGTPATVERTAAVDCQPPVISNVQVTSLTETSSTVSWSTDEPSTSRVVYGTAQPPGSAAAEPSLKTAHAVGLAGLPSCATHWFSISSTDEAGNVGVAPAPGSYRTFETLGRSYRLGPDDAEHGTGVWQVSGTAASAWHLDTCRSASPTRAWKAGAAAGVCPGQHANFVDTYLTSPVLDLGPAGHGYRLRFKEYYDTEAGYDFCRPQVSVDGGSTWTTLAQYSGRSQTWQIRDIDLSAFAGANVKIRFWFHSDDAVVNEGWYVDDIEISRAAPCGPALRPASWSLSPSCAVGGAGDGFVDPGETATLSVLAANPGVAGATNVTATLSTATPGVTVIRDAASFPNVSAGGAASSLAPHFSFAVGTGVPCGTAIPFTVAFASAEGAWSEEIRITAGNVQTATQTRAATDVPKPIADYPATTTSTVSVATAAAVADVDVGLTITHPYDFDLILFLLGPDGTRVTLSNQNGGDGDNYTGTLFDDEATTPITSGSPPFSGAFRPQEPLWAFDGRPAAGNWTLGITDNGPLDVGTLNAWSLHLTTQTVSCAVCAVVPPAEAVHSLSWSAGKRGLAWVASPGAAWYVVRRGDRASLPALLGPAADSCRRLTAAGPATGEVLDESPGSGFFHWYLVTAANPAGEGPAGRASAGPRTPNDGGSCP